METITQTATIDDMTVSLEDIFGAINLEETVKDTTVIEDPHFHGFNGEEYDFMGEDGSIYNIFSSGTLQINAKMTQYEHHLTFMTEVGIKVGNPEIGIQEIEIILEGEKMKCRFNGKDANRFEMQETLNFNTGLKNRDRSICYGWAIADLSGEWINVAAGSCRVHVYVTTEMYEGTVQCPCLNIVLTPEDIGLVSDGVSPHGILGVTAKYLKPRKPVEESHQGEGVIEGEPNDYIVTGLLADDFKFNRFGQEPDSAKIFGFRSGTKVDVIE